SPPASCSASEDRADSVIVQWVPGPGLVDSFTLYRDGQYLASVNGVTTRYADQPSLGPHTYCVYAVSAGGTSDACCDVGQINLAAAAGHLDFVRDVANDQGGRVMLGWTASKLDGPAGTVTSYRVWRRLPLLSQASAELSSTSRAPGEIRTLGVGPLA